MEDRIETGWLFDFYGPLLTKNQQELLELWCEEDLSMSEIAARRGVTRQGICETIHTAQGRLYRYEEQLGLLGRYRRLTDGLAQALQSLENVPTASAEETRKILTRLLTEEEV